MERSSSLRLVPSLCPPSNLLLRILLFLLLLCPNASVCRCTGALARLKPELKGTRVETNVPRKLTVTARTIFPPPHKAQIVSEGESQAAFTRIRIDPDIRMSQLRIGLLFRLHENDWSVRYPEQYATLSGAVRKRFQRWIIRMSRCSLETCKRGIRISGCHCACALRFPSTWKRFFFLLFASFKNFPSLFSCPLTAQSDIKVFHIASSILKSF